MKKKNRCADEFPSSSIRKYIGYPDSAYIHFDEVGAVLFIQCVVKPLASAMGI